MDIERIAVGTEPPWDVNVIVEIPMGGQPVKYEMDKDSNALFVDRFLHTTMSYPGNYGFIPHTLAEDGDPIDVLIVGPEAVVPGAVVRCRPIGLLQMADEKGNDEKVVAVPIDKLQPYFTNVRSYADLPGILLEQIRHFFTHYKDLERGRWAEVRGWEGPDAAARAIEAAVGRVDPSAT